MKGRINWKFFARLWTLPLPFTTAQAEALYVEHHMERYRDTLGRVNTDTVWPRMSARNTLTMGVQRGLLTRRSRGVYSFTPQGALRVKQIKREAAQLNNRTNPLW